MKYFGYLISLFFMLVGAFSFAVWDQTKLGISSPFTAQYTVPGLFWFVGWFIFHSVQSKYRVGILNWVGGFILFISIFIASQDIEDFLSDRVSNLDLSFLFWLSVSVLFFIYSFKQNEKKRKNI